MELSVYQTNPKTESLAILQRITKADKTAVKNIYGDFVWTMAKKHTASPEKAEVLTQEIFLDIWKYAGRFDPTKFDETTFVFLIAHRRLVKESVSSKTGQNHLR
jgi:RNA polymerase sigma-70 factor (ECF subfamily)